MQWDFRSDLWWQSWNWECEKWQAFRFAISPLPTDATFKMSLHFFHLWSVGQKGFLSDFEKMVYSWIPGQNVHKLQILLFSASYIASILKMQLDIEISPPAIDWKLNFWGSFSPWGEISTIVSTFDMNYFQVWILNFDEQWESDA